MEFYQKHNRILKRSGLVLLCTSSFSWLILQSRKTCEILNSLLDIDVLNYVQPLKYEVLPAKVDDKYIVIDWLKSYEDIEGASGKSWKLLKYMFARRLLNLAGNDNLSIRRKALEYFVKIKDLEDCHYSLLINEMTAKAAVGLARTPGLDLRYLSKQAISMKCGTDYVLNYLRDFFVAVSSKSNHSCFAYFISKAFYNEDNERFIDHESVLAELRKLIKSANNILPLCLEALLHHSSVKNYARDIVLCNGLTVLKNIHNKFKDDTEMNVIICNILANISAYPEFLEDIYRSGWIQVLAEWVNSDEMRISAPAAVILANFDEDDEFDAAYSRQIYLLHPTLRTSENIKVDVVFVHGLLGGVFYTWRQRNRNEAIVGFLGKKSKKESLTSDSSMTFKKSSDPIMREYMEDVEEHQKHEWDKLGQDFEFVFNDIPVNINERATGTFSCPGNAKCVKSDVVPSYTFCWPKDWLPKDCHGVRVMGINYDTNLSMWTPLCPDGQTHTTLEERSNNFTARLVEAGVGQRPIVWVTHSMGGLLVKSILCKASESQSEDVRNLVSSTKGIVFFSTPHTGSKLATLSQATSLVLLPSVEVQELREESPILKALHSKFLTMIRDKPIQIISFVETKSTLLTALKFNFVFVDPESSNPSVGELFEIPQDHLGICKPANKQSFLYQKVLHLVKEVARNEKQLV